MTIEQNRFQNYATRQIRLVTGVQASVLNFDCDTGVNWQAWIFSNEFTDKSTWVKFVISGSFGTFGEIEARIGGGKVGGDIITGTGPCKVFAVGEGNNLFSCWFTPEQTSTAIAPKSQFFDLPAIAIQTLGYPPFRRNFFSVQTTAPYDVIFEDDTGTQVYIERIDPLVDRTIMQRMVHPPNCVLKLVSTVAPQRFTVTHYN